MRKAISSGDRLFCFSALHRRDVSARGEPSLAGHREVRGSDFDNRSSRLRLRLFRVFRFLALLGLVLRFWRECRLLRPDSVDAAAISRNSAIVAEKYSAGLEWFIGPGIVAEAMPPVGGTGQSHDLSTILRIVPPIIEDNVDGAVGRIHCQPLKELLRSIVRPAEYFSATIAE